MYNIWAFWTSQQTGSYFPLKSLDRVSPHVNKALCCCKRKLPALPSLQINHHSKTIIYSRFSHISASLIDVHFPCETLPLSAVSGFSAAYSSPWKSHPSLASVSHETRTPRFHRGRGCAGPPAGLCEGLGATLRPVQAEPAIRTTLLFLFSFLPFCLSFICGSLRVKAWR